MTLNECMCLLSQWYKAASEHQKSNRFKRGYLCKIKELSEALINTSFVNDANFIYIDQQILSMKIEVIYPHDDDFMIGYKTSHNELYHITDKWRKEYYSGRLY